jgi:hypothetical protein
MARIAVSRVPGGFKRLSDRRRGLFAVVNAFVANNGEELSTSATNFDMLALCLKQESSNI